MFHRAQRIVGIQTSWRAARLTVTRRKEIMHSPKQSLLEKTEPKENWAKMWSSMSNSLNAKDVYYTLDEIKFGYACDLVKPHYQSALEVGCGSARVSCFFARRGFQCACLDYTEEALRVARENFRFIQASGTFIQGEADRIPFPDGHFDVVFSTGLLEKRHRSVRPE